VGDPRHLLTMPSPRDSPLVVVDWHHDGMRLTVAEAVLIGALLGGLVTALATLFAQRAAKRSDHLTRIWEREMDVYESTLCVTQRLCGHLQPSPRCALCRFLSAISSVPRSLRPRPRRQQPGIP
jgi:hypothetical protein